LRQPQTLLVIYPKLKRAEKYPLDYKQTGPWRDAPGHDVNFQALAGALARRDHDDRDPEVPRLPVADLEGGTVSALLICAAWARRLRTGEGEYIDVAMADTVQWWVGTESGTSHEDHEGRTFGSPGYGTFRTADGAWIALGVLGEQRLWDNTCRALEFDDLTGLPFRERLARTTEVNDRIAMAIARLEHASALALLSSHDVPVSPVLTPEDAAGHPQFLARELHVETSTGRVAALPARLASGGARPTRVPAVGEHPDGFTSADVRAP
jgi:crotonobetainyl-CoA:carnitine CoA-transferase CaiB-like acyl-CoA transferase